jgi:hypothetical protein
VTNSSAVTAPGPPAPAPADDDAPAVVRASPRARRVLSGVTVLVTAFLLWGTFWGTDDHFPFGPFRMYANASATNGVVRSARVEAVDETGHRFKLSDASTGLRRAEIEGQMPRFREDGDRLEAVADAFHARHPDAPELVLVEILQRRYHLVDGEPSGEVTEVQVAAWAAPGHEDLADYEARIAAEEAAERADDAGAEDGDDPSDGAEDGGGS